MLLRSGTPGRVPTFPLWRGPNALQFPPARRLGRKRMQSYVTLYLPTPNKRVANPSRPALVHSVLGRHVRHVVVVFVAGVADFCAV